MMADIGLSFDSRVQSRFERAFRPHNRNRSFSILPVGTPRVSDRIERIEKRDVRSLFRTNRRCQECFEHDSVLSPER